MTPATGDDITHLFLDLNGKGQTIFMITHNPANAEMAHLIMGIGDGGLEN